MESGPLFTIDNSTCVKCYSCVRICPVKAIKVDVNTGFPAIVDSRCIGCGSCFKACSAQSIRYRSSMAEVKALLSSERPVAAICDPAISGEFDDITDYRKFVEMIRALGFRYVLEASFGVDLVAREQKKIFDDFKGKYHITSLCPAVVSYVEKYFPHLISNLVPLVSPMIAAAKVARSRYGPEIGVVWIGPCIAAKNEALFYEGEAFVDSVLTFTELRRLFSEFNIRESQVEFSDFDPPLGNKGSLYPISNGILQAVDISEDLLTGGIITAEGRNNMLDAVREFDTRTEMIHKHFNVFYDEGCLMGPGTSPNGEKFLRRTLVTDYANKRLLDFDTDTWKKDMEQAGSLSLSRSFRADDQRLPEPDEEKLQEILKMIDREHQIENDIGCEACGYSNCREFAVAIAQGLATTEMCHLFSVQNRQDYIKSLRQANEDLAKTQAALKESEENARKEKEAQKESAEITELMLQKLVSGVVIVDEKLRIIQSNQAFIRIMGEEAAMIHEVIPGLVGADLKTLLPVSFYKMFSYVLSTDESIEHRDVMLEDKMLSVSIFPIRSKRFVGGILRDMYTPEVRKQQILSRLNEVIDENFEMVQKIAFLLGESAAKTEQMLNSVIESHENPPKSR